MQQYNQYSFLWLQNQNETFEAFLDGRSSPNAKREQITQSRAQVTSKPAGAATRATSVAETEEGVSPPSTVRSSSRPDSQRPVTTLTAADATIKSSTALASPSRKTAFADEKADAARSEAMLSVEKEFLKQGRKGPGKGLEKETSKSQASDPIESLPSLYEFETEIEVYQVCYYDFHLSGYIITIVYHQKLQF